MRELYDADHAAFAESFRAFVERESGEPDALARAGRAGLLGMQVAEHHGGGGVDDPRFCAVAVEELVRASGVGVALSYVIQVGVGLSLLADHATADQQAEWLPPLAAGDTTVAVAVDRVGAEAGSGTLTLHGSCRCVVNGAHAALALVPVEVAGGPVAPAIVPLTTTGVRRSTVDGLGVREAGLADIAVDGVRIAESALMPAPALSQLDTDVRLWSAVTGLAGARTALDRTRGHVRDRTVFGRSLASFDNTRHVLGGLLVEVMAAQAFIDRCVTRRGARRLGVEESAAAKLVGTELFGRAADHGLQLHGGYGYMREYPISSLFADARFLRWYGGTSEALRLDVAGLMDL